MNIDYRVNQTDAGWTGNVVLAYRNMEVGYQNFSGYRINPIKKMPVGTKYQQSLFQRTYN